MNTSVIYPPDWHFADVFSASDLSVGDLVPVSMEKHIFGGASCSNCDGRAVLYAREITAFGPVTWIDGKMFHSRIVHAPCPVCQGAQLEHWLLENCGLSDKELNGKPATDVTISGSKPAKGQEEAFSVAARLLKELPAPRSWALFTGDNGRGKTHILFGLVNECRRKKVWALYSKSASILEAIRESYDDPGGSVTAAIRRRYENVPVLVVDELDRVRWSEWAAEQLFEILDARTLSGKATWFASNLGPSALEKTHGSLKAIVSRISAGEIVAVQGYDLRPASQPALPEHFID